MRILVNSWSCVTVVSRERHESSLWKITNDLKPSGNGTGARGSGLIAGVTVGGGSGGVARGAEVMISGG